MGKLMFSLTLTHLRFTVEALTPVRLSGYNAGSQLRGALDFTTPSSPARRR
jgi:hypothetical protein